MTVFFVVSFKIVGRNTKIEFIKSRQLSLWHTGPFQSKSSGILRTINIFLFIYKYLCIRAAERIYFHASYDDFVGIKYALQCFLNQSSYCLDDHTGLLPVLLHSISIFFSAR